ncbi:cysteine hydrolase [Amycolatopsis sp. NPDC004625]|uniref:cysteine hydrolase n=1 Tax=Amycolatopsis sp. NPDC004625 TaxID=3154670 RepID=UPI0033BB5962
MSIDSAALIVVDAQNGFVNLHSRHVVPAIEDLVTRWSALGLPVVFTRYFNYPDSPYERFLDWRELQGPPETDIVPELAEAAFRAHAVVDKIGYTVLNAEARELIGRAGWTDLVFCGIATESCVLKSAADAFEHGYAPWIVTDACASDAGPDVHDAGLLVARRLIGLGQLVTSEQVMARISARFGAPVME